MLGALKKHDHTPIGLDLGASGAKMLQLVRVDGGWSINACGRYDLPRSVPADGPQRQEALTEGIRALLASSPFHGRDVVSCLPVSVVQYKNTRMPQMPADELAQAVQWEAQDRLQLGDQGAKIQHLDAGDVRQGDQTRREVILMGVTDAALRDHIHVINSTGLNPVSVDVTPTAIARCFARNIRRQADMEAGHLFIDVGRSCSKVIILRGHTISFFKLIDIGGDHLDAAVAENVNLSHDEVASIRRRLADGRTAEDDDGKLFGSSRRDSVKQAVGEAVRAVVSTLAREIGLCLRYYSVTFRGARPTVAQLVGGEAHDAHLVGSLTDQLDLDVQVADPLPGIDRSHPAIAIERRDLMPEWAVAGGLVMRRLRHGVWPMRGAA
ncbi:MAG: hypothetical protein CMJ49_04435 [Planctomycetaceae bacterium]|nr:hypothetical protein [Planctomycetaceae bacterium]